MKLSEQINNFKKIHVFLGGGLALLVAFLVRICVGSPLAVLHRLNAMPLLPPLWLLSLLWLFWYALLGAAVGYLLACPTRGGHWEALLWRGGTFLVLAMVMSFVWYTLLFGKFSLFFSWLCLPVSIVLSLYGALSWWRVLKGAALLLFGFSLWLLVLFLFQFAVMLHN